METERFSVPELLFYPNDIGLQQAGLSETTWQSLHALDQVWLYHFCRYKMWCDISFAECCR
jgi:hypothetical protein